VFDDIDHLGDVDTLLYELPRTRAIDHITNSKVRVIGTNKNNTFSQDLSPKVTDTLIEAEISYRAS